MHRMHVELSKEQLTYIAKHPYDFQKYDIGGIINNSGNDFEFIKIAVVFYDESGNAIGYQYSYANCLTDGSVDYLSFDYPYDREYETIYPSSYKLYVNEAYIWMP